MLGRWSSVINGELCTGAKEVAEQVQGRPSGAEARNQNNGFIAAVNRCATQNQTFSAICKALVIDHRDAALKESVSQLFFRPFGAESIPT